jgi:hypothetical protein
MTVLVFAVVPEGVFVEEEEDDLVDVELECQVKEGRYEVILLDLFGYLEDETHLVDLPFHRHPHFGCVLLLSGYLLAHFAA